MSNTAKSLDDGLTAYKQQNYCEAEIWMILAKQGDAEVQFNLGVLYKDGIGVRQDHSEAINWPRKSSNQGHEHARLILSMLEEQSANDYQDEAKE